MQLIDILKKIPVTEFEGYGQLIDFGSILNTLKIFTSASSDLIEIKLRELSKEGLLEIIQNKTDGFEELIVGVKLKN